VILTENREKSDKEDKSFKIDIHDKGRTKDEAVSANKVMINKKKHIPGGRESRGLQQREH
jgi:hypothetical protein